MMTRVSLVQFKNCVVLGAMICVVLCVTEVNSTILLIKAQKTMTFNKVQCLSDSITTSFKKNIVQNFLKGIIRTFFIYLTCVLKAELIT